mgnify:CR=1 FL=1
MPAGGESSVTLSAPGYPNRSLAGASTEAGIKLASGHSCQDTDQAVLLSSAICLCTSAISNSPALPIKSRKAPSGKAPA